MNSCLFCKIIEKKIEANIIYESDKIICFLDIAPINEGHILIVPKKHCLDVDEIEDELLQEIMTFSQKIVKVIKKCFSPKGYTIMQNGGEFNDIGHYHLHIFPRYRDDGFGWNSKEIKPNLTKTMEDLKKILDSM